jgi:methylenetetrahydrofolate dehydrogenase (NADP+)/methenyltetrahydrofolate cyclohydrolase
MTAKVIDGVKLAASLREQVAERAAVLARQGVKPGLAVVLVGSDAASQVYVRNKVAACEKAGLHSVLEQYPADLTEDALLSRIKTLNADHSIHGILVQLPLPKHIDAHRVIEAIAAEKDVDGFHVSNAGLLMTGTPLFTPCTPYGVMKILESEQISLRGAVAVVVGASNIVGKPMAMLLQAAGSTVTICNSKTRDLAWHTRHADIVVVATGKPGMVTGDMIKPGAIVIELCGDVDYASVSQVAGAITPVPGGVGPMTIAMLLVNTIEAAERSNASGITP